MRHCTVSCFPLWEGFDEPFHFGYVQQLANGNGLPDAGSAQLSREIGDSIRWAPASPIVQCNLPQVATYSAYFSWSAEKRLGLRRRIREIPRDFRWEVSEFLNYEAHQPPLAYLGLALPERLLSGVPLPARVAILRMIAAGAGGCLLLMGAGRLFGQLEIPQPFRAAGLFCLFSSQMTWATVAHVGNDWLAVPVAVWILVALNRVDRGPVAAAGWLAAGLLTKAYCLAFAPLLIGVWVWRRRWRDLAIGAGIVGGIAGPWYVRNLILLCTEPDSPRSANGNAGGARRRGERRACSARFELAGCVRGLDPGGLVDRQ